MRALSGEVPRPWPKMKLMAMERAITASVKPVASTVQKPRSMALRFLPSRIHDGEYSIRLSGSH